MKLTFTTIDGKLFTLDVPNDLELENLKAYCEAECEIPAEEITLLVNGNPLTDSKKTVEQYCINDGDMLFLQRTPRTSRGNPMPAAPMDFSSIRVPGSGASTSRPRQRYDRQRVDPYALREALLSNPGELALVKQNNPPLADALLNGTPEKFAEVFNQQDALKRQKEAEQVALLSGDPFDPDVQRRIAEAIQQENVNANMEAAMEFAPESFGQVHMLYINCKVNGHSVKAFVDSGAQMTIMSKACAERCHISHLMDTRWAGIAKGVGVQRILGRIHMCQIAIQNDHLQCSFSILEEQPMDMLLGLDMLKRHQCCLDLKRNILVIGTTGTETPFLSESELPEYAKLNRSLSQMEQDHDLAEAMSRSTQGSTTASTSSATSSSAAASAQSTGVSEASINRLITSGFTREQAVAELRRTSGNEEAALMNLLARSIAIPKK